MTASSQEMLEALKTPAVLLNGLGEILSWNTGGQALLPALNSQREQLIFPLLENRPFEYYLGDYRMLQVNLTDTHGHYLAQSVKLTEAEVRLAMFRAVAKSVNSSLILEEIFDALGKVLQTYIPFTLGKLVILDETQNATRVIVSLDHYGHALIDAETIIFTGNDPLLRSLLESQEQQFFQSPFPNSILLAQGAEQAVVIPLVGKGLVIGAISLCGGEFTALERQLLDEVGEPLAIAIENARLYWQTQSQAGRQFLINQITKAIRQSLNLKTILQTTVKEIGQVMGLSRCQIDYWGTADTVFESFQYVIPGMPSITDAMIFSQFERDLFAQRAASPHQYNPFILNDVRQFAPGPGLVVLAEEKIKSLAVFPVLVEDTTFVGTISLHQCDTFRAWLPEEIDLLRDIAEHVAVALYQANLFEEKEQRRQQLEVTLAELQQAQMQLIQSEKMAVLGQFVAGIAHEVNTPLGTMMANDDTVKYCLEKMPADDPAIQKYRQSALELLDINRLASERIQEIVKNLRNFARLDESDLKQVDPHEGLDATLLLILSANKEKVTIEKHYGVLPLVECFPGLLNQVFMNLIVNAIQSIETRGVITIATQYQPDTDWVEVAISDTGKGIAPEHIVRIFDPGFTTKGVGVGTGLGLALCYRIMEKHHGHITVESHPGHGTTMRVSLPAKQRSAP